MKIAITGKPGIGKTTLCEKLITAIPGAAGIITSEIRDDAGTRCGFEMRDVHSNELGLLAHTKIKTEPKIGKYGINSRIQEHILEPALDYALTSAKWIVLDEIAPMELKLDSFLPLTRRVLLCNKPVVLTYQQKLSAPIVNEITRQCRLEVVTRSNRDALVSAIHDQIETTLK